MMQLFGAPFRLALIAAGAPGFALAEPSQATVAEPPAIVMPEFDDQAGQGADTSDTPAVEPAILMEEAPSATPDAVMEIVEPVAPLIEAKPAPQQTTETLRIGDFKDWSVFALSDSTFCWVASLPSDQAITRDGKPVKANRGDISLMVSLTAAGEFDLIWNAGFPIDAKFENRLSVKGNDYSLHARSQGAWLSEPSETADVIAAMKSAGELSLVSRSQRGTDIADSFSTMGFTAALEQAQATCAGDAQ